MHYRLGLFFHNLFLDQRKSLLFVLFVQDLICIVPTSETSCELYFNSYAHAMKSRSMILQEFPYVTPSDIVEIEKFNLLAER